MSKNSNHYNLRRGPSNYRRNDKEHSTINNDGHRSAGPANSQTTFQNIATSDEESNAGTVTGDRQENYNADSSESEHEENPNPWVKVGPRRRAVSLDSARSQNEYQLRPAQFTAKKQREAKKPPVMTIAQGALIREAEKKLSQAERKAIRHRMKIIGQSPAQGDNGTDSSLSDGERPSNDKGKGVDPKNWGNINLPNNEVDIDQQRAVLENFVALHEAQQQAKVATEPEPLTKKPKKPSN